MGLERLVGMLARGQPIQPRLYRKPQIRRALAPIEDRSGVIVLENGGKATLNLVELGFQFDPWD